MLELIFVGFAVVFIYACFSRKSSRSRVRQNKPSGSAPEPPAQRVDGWGDSGGDGGM